MLAWLLLEILIAIYAGNMMMSSMDVVIAKQTSAEEENAMSVVHNFLYSGYEDRDMCVPANAEPDYTEPVDSAMFKKKNSSIYTLVSSAKKFDRCDIVYEADSRTLYVRIGAKTFKQTQLPKK